MYVYCIFHEYERQSFNEKDTSDQADTYRLKK